MSSSFSNAFNTTVNKSVSSDDRSNILAWLSPLDPGVRHRNIQDRRVENVGEWLLRIEEFGSWRAGVGEGESNNAVLFCYGDPGVGKTFISSLVIDRLCDQDGGQGATVACFYFDFAAREEQSPTSVMGALLKQVVSEVEEVPKEIVQAYEDQKKTIGGRGPQLADVVTMLQTTTSKRPVFICMDALDECVPGYRVKILDSLDQTLQKCPGTRVFVTGRPHIRAEVRKRLPGKVTAIRITSRRHDIVSYLHTRLDEDTTPDAMDSGLEEDILKKIPEDISEIFLLVSLNIDAILQETTIRRRRQKLNAMTDGLGLGGVYGETLSRIKGQGGERSRLGMATLMWISHAERPLKVDELCHALGVEIGSADLDGDNVPSTGTLLACCQGLVAVDKKTSTVRLIHFTLQEYLLAHPELFGRAHSTIAETCLSYLNSHQVKALSTSPYPDLRGTPFLEYSSLYWGMHAKRDLSDCAKRLALMLFDDYSNHVSARILLDAEKSRLFHIGFDKLFRFSGLHCASFLGVVGLVAGFLEARGGDINQTDCTGSTPLLWASLNGHEEVVKILLGRSDINPDRPDIYGRTPLRCAAAKGRQGVVKILLGRGDVNSDEPDFDNRTPLWGAASSGHDGVVKILLRHGHVNPDKPDRYGRTPLWDAARNGHEGVVKILLGRGDVNPNKPDEDGRTPLRCAAWNGHEGAVKILLERDDVNPDKPDICGQTPLACAAVRGHQGVVEALLGKGAVNPDKPDKYGRTPLWCAAGSGHEGVVKTLLGRRDVNPNRLAEYGQSPLWCAASYGHEAAVKTLLRHGDVNPDKTDRYGRTPLWCAAENGHEGVVKTLLGCGDVTPDKPAEYGQSPLWCAAFYGHEGVVKTLLGRGDVDPDRPDIYGRTPLGCAAGRGHEGVVQILLEKGAVNLDRPDKHGRTPLWHAVVRGHEGVVKILLGRDDVNPYKADNHGQPPFWYATERSHASNSAATASNTRLSHRGTRPWRYLSPHHFPPPITHVLFPQRPQQLYKYVYSYHCLPPLISSLPPLFTPLPSPLIFPSLPPPISFPSSPISFPSSPISSLPSPLLFPSPPPPGSEPATETQIKYFSLGRRK